MVQIKKMLLTPDKWVRPQDKLKSVDALVWHWVANPNSTAIANRNFFENRTGSYGSAHYIIGLQGEIIQCLPEDEIGYHVGSHVYTSRSLRELGSYPNNNTIGIECTHIDWDGKMKDETYEALIELSVDILKRHNLTADDIWLHQEVVGWKDCHRFFVRNQDEYKKAKEEIAKRLGQKAPKPPIKTDPKDVDMPKMDSNGMYTVQKGDTLWAISRAFNVTIEQLEKLNPNVEAKMLKIGSKVKVKQISNSKPNQSKPKSEKYNVVKDIPGYYTAADAKSKKNKRTTVKKGSYFVFNKSNGTINVSAKEGVAGSWINPSENTITNSSNKPSATLKVGSKVVLSKSATKYATGQNIPSSIKGKEYTIMQLKSDRALLKEIYSWVFLKDIGGSSPSPTKSSPKKTISQMADEIINNPKVPTGHENRRKWLGIDETTYEKVRAEVNRRL